MESTRKSTKSNYKTIAWIVFLAFLLLFALKFIYGEVNYFKFTEDVFGRYWSVRWPLLGHITGGILALVIGPFQFVQYLRRKYISLHKNLGRIYLSAILISSICSVYLSWTAALDMHWAWAVSLQGLALAWIGTTFMAYRAIMKKRIQIHKEWMIRSYIVTFSFVIFRWLVYNPTIAELGDFFDRAPTMVWISWVIPLFITEIILQWNKE